MSVEEDLAECRYMLGRLEEHHERALRNLALWASRGFPGGGDGRTSGVSDPTFMAVANEHAVRDAANAATDRANLIDAVKMARNKLFEADKLTMASITKLSTKKPGVSGCKLCEIVKQRDGQPYKFQEEKAKGLCAWHIRFIDGDQGKGSGYGVHPHNDIVRWHLEHLGDEVPARMVRQYHPAAFQERHGARKAS